MIARGTLNYNLKRPLAVSYELTHSCNCNCRHCDHGGIKPGEKQIGAKEYGRLQRELKPILVQLSGGEPTLRSDLIDIVNAIKERSGLPYLIVVTNAAHLTEECYLDLVRAGVNQVSISLDFPDDRHDKFRRHKGLFSHLSELVPKLAAHGRDNIVLNTAITSWNLPYLEGCYETARKWGTSISYSPYTVKRIGAPEYDITHPTDIALLEKSIDRLVSVKHRNGRIVNSDWTLTGIVDFFKNEGTPGCKAGERFLVVNPDGTLRPCSMWNYRFNNRHEMHEQFVKSNDCSACYVAIRAYLSEDYWKLLLIHFREKVLGKSGPNGDNR
jgi:MoaA/NifB/PqqE/SkfB family radical SAM enzyme